MPVPISPDLPRKHLSHGASAFRTRLPVTRTRISINHSRQNPIALCTNANSPFSTRGAVEPPGDVPGEVPIERCDVCDSKAITNAVIFAGSRGGLGIACGDLPLKATAFVVFSVP